MARKMTGRLLCARMLIRAAYAAVSLDCIPYAKGAETDRPVIATR